MHNFIENELVILTKQTLDIFLKQDNPADLIALYTFYYYTAKWQCTNQPKCTTEYAAKGLGWGVQKVRKVKKQLIEFGLIEDVRKVDEKTKKTTGHFIKMNYIFKKETLEKSHSVQDQPESHPVQNPPGGNKTEKNAKTTLTVSHRVAHNTPNALSTNNINALSTNSILKENKKEKNDEAVDLNVVEIIDFLNEKANKNFRLAKKETRTLIKNLLQEGFTVDDFKQVINNQVIQWKDNPDWDKYLRPSTLFSPKKFENYLNNCPTKKQSPSNESASYNLDLYLQTMDTFS